MIRSRILKKSERIRNKKELEEELNLEEKLFLLALNMKSTVLIFQDY